MSEIFTLCVQLQNMMFKDKGIVQGYSTDAYSSMDAEFDAIDDLCAPL